METKQQILRQAILLFAKHGYAGVSMRDLAKSVNLGVSGIYHHFSDKKTLYLQAMKMAFSNKAQAFTEVWQSELPAQEKLKAFVSRLTELMQADPDFHILMHRELLDADPTRMELLAEEVFKFQFTELIQVIESMAPDKDAHLSAVSVIALVCQHMEMQPLRVFLPGYQSAHENADILAAHVSDLLINGLHTQTLGN